uniref:Uncharacterized protein n=1 Tax=Gloeothece verrucosa (strain PCC 7822) TaxID=497965 RepID=E0UKK4_GLOV7|nr:hypothetical protein Cyan7822_5618 [Gloeothece verrucosa PCC 7822]
MLPYHLKYASNNLSLFFPLNFFFWILIIIAHNNHELQYLYDIVTVRSVTLYTRIRQLEKALIPYRLGQIGIVGDNTHVM